jgi:N-methylhydantoinase A
VGQEYSISLPISSPFNASALSQLPSEFHEAYLRRYGHSTPSEEIEIVNLRLRAVGHFRTKGVSDVQDSAAAQFPTRNRPVYFDGKWQTWPILRRESLSPGFAFGGPAVIEEPSCTTVVPPSFDGQVDEFGNLILRNN